VPRRGRVPWRWMNWSNSLVGTGSPLLPLFWFAIKPLPGEAFFTAAYNSLCNSCPLVKFSNASWLWNLMKAWHVQSFSSGSCSNNMVTSTSLDGLSSRTWCPFRSLAGTCLCWCLSLALRSTNSANETWHFNCRVACRKWREKRLPLVGSNYPEEDFRLTVRVLLELKTTSWTGTSKIVSR